jgi:ketosteroid isomerase-like protein
VRVSQPESICCSAVLFVLVLLAAELSAAWAGGPCVGEAPASVLDCLVQAYQTRDVEAIDALYAPDFEFWFGTEESHTSWGRVEELESATNMFANARVQEIRLELDGAREVVSGTEPNTWIIRGVYAHIRVTADQSAEPYKVEGQDHEFLVRLVAEPTPHWQIYRWTDPNSK